ncbi:hypothetical protein [Castellaniella caeni]|uniref:hypothetical protein n=1 Tax=Castellaniella caeni TaxID=266123 RepID=UPI0011AF152E|nr:hypothetical protein [Castellaniella caeni]
MLVKLISSVCLISSVRRWCCRRTVDACLGRIARGLAIGVLSSLCAGSLAAAGGAWTADQTSQGLQAVGRPVVVSFQPGARAAAIPAGARITQVYASRAYDSSARIASQLCWGTGQGVCVPLQGSHLNTHAFDGRAAQGPLSLVHTVVQWGRDHPPVFVRGTVTVWYSVD